MIKYDFVLFENYYQAFNHYKDVAIIAVMLKQSGYSVAIADVFGEEKGCVVEGIPHISFKNKCPVNFFDNLKKSNLRKHIDAAVCRWRYSKYLCSIIDELEGSYRHLYCGSYHIDMSIRWLHKIPKSSSVFFWGLRSSRLIEYKHLPFSRVKIQCYRLRKFFDRHPNFKFFVSDEIIRKEFLDLGIVPKRLVLRPERYIEKLTARKDKDTNNKQICFLSIGSLRKEKRIERIVDSFKELSLNDMKYVIAGKTNSEYEEVIKEHTQGLSFVERRNYRIPEDEYNQLFIDSDFLILCDIQQLSSVTNGTMNEALFHGVPIIAPNYNPYKYYIEQYGIGVLFDPNKLSSLVDAITIAYNKGKTFFSENIKKYQSEMLLERVVERFKNELLFSLEGE